MKRMKKRYVILAAALLVIITGLVVVSIANGPLSKSEMTASIDKELATMVNQHDEITSALLTIYSDKLQLNEAFSAGYTSTDFSEPVTVHHPYYSASIGKTFTATVIAMLYEENILDFDDLIVKYLDNALLESLFVYEGVDYKDQVTIRQLLAHTSGIGDYFEDDVTQGDTMTEILLKEPGKIWTPLTLLSFTRENQQPVARPGDVFHYSDTGYILLGFIVEAVTGREFHEVLHERILDPLEMNDTCMVFKSSPKNPQTKDILEVYVQGIDLSDTNALSFDWSGGGLVTTMADLLIFSRALNGGRLVSYDTLNQMTDFSHEYLQGVHYGLGMMEFRFGEFSFFLKGTDDIYGGVGSSATFMMYDKTNDIHVIANFGTLNFMEQSVRFLSKVLMTVDRLKE